MEPLQKTKQLQGKCLWYDKKEKNGVIQELDGFQFFVSDSGLVDLNYLDAGDLVFFEKENDDTMQAVNVQLNSPHKDDCGADNCQECCMHDEWDHDQCVDCGKERCPGEAIDRAMDYFEDR